MPAVDRPRGESATSRRRDTSLHGLPRGLVEALLRKVAVEMIQEGQPPEYVERRLREARRSMDAFNRILWWKEDLADE